MLKGNMDNPLDDVLQAITYMVKSVSENDELFPTMAKCYKKMLDAMMAEGFSREEAVMILAHQGMGFKANQ